LAGIVTAVTACSSGGDNAQPTSVTLAPTSAGASTAVQSTAAAVTTPATAAATATSAPAARAPATTAPATTAGGSGVVIDPGDGGRYTPVIDPAEFSAVVTNPWFPLVPGERWVYESTSSDGDQQITVEVLAEPRSVMGVPVVQVHDVVSQDRTTVEDTVDLYSQHADGTVWYFGEATTAYDHGMASTEGSWEAGVDGALPGVIMPATPMPSQRGYRQEFYAGHAEDMGRIIGVAGSADVPAGHFGGLVVTRDWTPLEPDVVEEKSYAHGVGVVQEVTTSGGDEVVRLVEHHPGG
jgi:hypothetical protein